MTEAAADRAAVQRILEERARALAVPPPAEETAESVVMVVLPTGGERYGVEIRFVQEVQPLRDLTPLPGTPAYWPGVVNLRGRLFPVLDLRKFLGLPEIGGARDPHIALVSAGGLTAALLTDELPGVERLARDRIGAPPAEAGGARREAIRGITPDLLSILDAEKLLADPALSVSHEAE